MSKRLAALLFPLLLSVLLFIAISIVPSKAQAELRCPPGTTETVGFVGCLDANGNYVDPIDTNDGFINMPAFEAMLRGREEAITSNTVNVNYLSSDVLTNNISTILGLITSRYPEEGANGTAVYEPGLLEFGSNAIAYMYSKPAASTEVYIADVLNSAGIGIVQPAYAQGLGFSALNPILETWKIFRNIAYLFFVIIFVVIGFMIMFRQKIGGQTVVTAQQAIPQIIIALLAVTFSYAIAGLLIDAMYLFMYIMLGLFGESNIISFSIFTMTWKLIVGGSSDAYNAISNFIAVSINVPGINGIADSLLGGGVGLLAAAIVAVAIVVGMFRLFFELLKTYISIIISVTISPLYLMVTAIPGKNNFMGWVKGLVGNLSAFPTVLLVLIIYDKLTGSLSGGSAPIESGGFSPPYLIGIGNPGTLSFLLGLGMIMIITDIVKEAKKLMGASGGVFEQFTTNLADSIKTGWKGGELVPGVGFTDTGKYGIKGANNPLAFAKRVAMGSEASRKMVLEDKEGSIYGRGVIGFTRNLAEPYLARPYVNWRQNRRRRQEESASKESGEQVGRQKSAANRRIPNGT